MKGISVIICTYNGKKTILQTLAHLQQQRFTQNMPWEIIIIDNASTDDTYAIVDEYILQQKIINARLLKQPVPGKTYALEKGLNESIYDYVIICDDDNWLAEDYLQTSFELIEADEEIGIIGGLGEPVCEVSPPAWFETMKGWYAVGPQNSSNGIIDSKRGWVFGAGMVVRKAAWIQLKTLQYPNILTCRKGDALSAGGDVEMCFSMEVLGYEIHYDDRLKFKHYIPAPRLQWNYLLRLYKGSAEAEVYTLFIRFFDDRSQQNSKDPDLVYTKMLKRKLYGWRRYWYRTPFLQADAIPEGNVAMLDSYYQWGLLKSLLLNRKSIHNHLRNLQSFVHRMNQSRLRNPSTSSQTTTVDKV